MKQQQMLERDQKWEKREWVREKVEYKYNLQAHTTGKNSNQLTYTNDGHKRGFTVTAEWLLLHWAHYTPPPPN